MNQTQPVPMVTPVTATQMPSPARSSKGLILLAFVAFIIVCVIVILIAAVASQNTNNNNNPPTSTPVSSPDVNIININPGSTTQFKFAVINPDDTIELRNTISDKFIIQLQRKHWKDLQWAPNNNLITVLGDSGNGIFDIYLYNIAQKSWTKITDFSAFTSGVDSYTWQSADTIYFVQGQEPNRWLHRFRYSSINEIIKLAQVSGNISGVSPDKNNIIVQNGTVFMVYNKDGSLVSNQSNLIDSNNKIINVAKLNFNSDSSKVLIQTQDQSFFKEDFGNRVVVKLSATNFQTVCDINADVFMLVNVIPDSSRVKIADLNTKEDTVSYTAEGQIPDFMDYNLDKSSCFENDNVLFNITLKDGTSTWYSINSGELEEMAALKGAVEAKAMNSNN